MKRMAVLFQAALLGAFGLAATQAQAGPQWTFDFSSSTASVASDSKLNEIVVQSQPLLHAAGNSDIVAANLSVKTPVSGSSDTFTHRVYTLMMKLTDVGSGASTLLTFTGDFDGTITPTSSLVANHFHAPKSQEAHLGNHEYTVTLNAFTPMGPAGGLPGSIGAHVDVETCCCHHDGKPTVNITPEPGSAFLLSIGGAFLGFSVWRRKRVVSR